MRGFYEGGIKTPLKFDGAQAESLGSTTGISVPTSATRISPILAAAPIYPDAARTELAERSKVVGKSFWRLMQHVAVVAGLTHVAFCVLFYALGAWTMVWTNVASIALFAASFVLLRMRRNQWAAIAIVTEIFLHAALAVRAIGWDSGFHYYLIMMPPIVMISPTRHPGSRLVLAASVCGIYLTLDAFTRATPPLHAISPAILGMLRYFNVVVTFSMLTYLASSYLRLVKQAESQLRLAATTDPLTKLINRRRVTEIYRYEVTRRKRESYPLSFVLCDVDHFKNINDHHGHGAGDKVLVAVAEALRAALREQDSVARWGGEEFLVVMPNTQNADAMMVAERMREQISALAVPFGDATLQVQMTFGVATHHEGEEAETAITRADQALYKGKQAGRNRVVSA